MQQKQEKQTFGSIPQKGKLAKSMQKYNLKHTMVPIENACLIKVIVCLRFKNMNHSETNAKSFQKKISARFLQYPGVRMRIDLCPWWESDTSSVTLKAFHFDSTP